MTKGRMPSAVETPLIKRKSRKSYETKARSQLLSMVMVMPQGHQGRADHTAHAGVLEVMAVKAESKCSQVCQAGTSRLVTGGSEEQEVGNTEG